MFNFTYKTTGIIIEGYDCSFINLITITVVMVFCVISIT